MFARPLGWPAPQQLPVGYDYGTQDARQQGINQQAPTHTAVQLANEAQQRQALGAGNASNVATGGLSSLPPDQSNMDTSVDEALFDDFLRSINSLDGVGTASLLTSPPHDQAPTALPAAAIAQFTSPHNTQLADVYNALISPPPCAHATSHGDTMRSLQSLPSAGLEFGLVHLLSPPTSPRKRTTRPFSYRVTADTAGTLRRRTLVQGTAGPEQQGMDVDQLDQVQGALMEELLRRINDGSRLASADSIGTMLLDTSSSLRALLAMPSQDGPVGPATALSLDLFSMPSLGKLQPALLSMGSLPSINTDAETTSNVCRPRRTTQQLSLDERPAWLCSAVCEQRWVAAAAHVHAAKTQLIGMLACDGVYGSGQSAQLHAAALRDAGQRTLQVCLCITANYTAQSATKAVSCYVPCLP